VILAPALLMAMVSQARAAPPEELLAATLAAVRTGPGGRVALLVARGEALRRAAARTSLAWLAAACAVGVLAAAVPIAWAWLPDSGVRIVAAGDGGRIRAADGAEFPAVPGRVLAPGTEVLTASGAEVAFAGATGRWTLRDGGRARITTAGLRLESGALAGEADGAVVETPRLRIRADGRLWILAVPAFDRVDLLAGAADIEAGTAAVRLHGGEALVVQPGQAPQRVPCSPAELAPAFGGLFFRETAAVYATGRLVLAGGPGPVTGRWAMDATAAAAALEAVGPAGPLAVRSGDRLSLRHPGGPGPVRAFIPVPAGAPGLVQVLGTRADFRGRSVVNDGSVLVPYAASPWRDPGVPASATEPPVATRPPVTGLLHAAVQVGLTPDGDGIWEKTLRHVPTGRWAAPSLLIGPPPRGWEVVIDPGGAIDLTVVTVAEGLLPR
jgi:hypothetical protein